MNFHSILNHFNQTEGHPMTQEEKIDALTEAVASLKAQLDRQDEQLDYIVKRLNHMREKAHAERENKTAWPK